MNIRLKQTIIAHIFDNIDNFQIVNNTTDTFKAYIYDSEGEYLIGGKQVSDFIDSAIKLLRSN